MLQDQTGRWMLGPPVSALRFLDVQSGTESNTLFNTSVLPQLLERRLAFDL